MIRHHNIGVYGTATHFVLAVVNCLNDCRRDVCLNEMARPGMGLIQ